MRLATVRRAAGTPQARTQATVLDVDGRHHLLPAAGVEAVLALPAWQETARRALDEAPLGSDRSAEQFTLAPVVINPGKVICCGLNFADHITEMGRDLPEYPTLFAKYADTLIGANDEILAPPAAQQALDWEAELAVVVGATLVRADRDTAALAIAGYTIANDVSMRDWQHRTLQWFQGKAWDASTPVGPFLVTPDEVDPVAGLTLRCTVDGQVRQESTTRELVFDAPSLLAYISSFTALRIGDLVLLGTPGGVGSAAKPPTYLRDGSRMLTEIENLGRLDNTVRFLPVDETSSAPTALHTA
ncbi:MAG: fumarylacetoacetate hydrolase family protein [Nakamurella sp.]